MSQQPALGYMQIVPDQTAQTLLPIIQRHTLPNTTVHSDQWQSYSRVQTLPNVSSYSAVNHSLHFVDPTTGVHTQNVESYWGRVKLKFKRRKGCQASQLPSYLDEFMWCKRYINAEPFCSSCSNYVILLSVCRFGRTAVCMSNIIQDIAQQYPVP